MYFVMRVDGMRTVMSHDLKGGWKKEKGNTKVFENIHVSGLEG